MQCGTLLGQINWIAPEHCVDAITQVAFLGKLDKQPERFIGYPVFRIVKINSGGFGRKPPAACGVICKKLTQMQRFNRLIMRFQRFPRGTPGQSLRRE